MLLGIGVECEKIKYYVKSHDKMYIITRCIKSLNNLNFIKLIRGYYDGLQGYILTFIEQRRTEISR